MTGEHVPPTLAGISTALAGWWRWPLRDEELAVLTAATNGWPTLQPLATAVERAVKAGGDRPAMASLVRDARFILRQQSEPAPTRPGCAVCRGDLWVRHTDPEGVEVVTACPRCMPVTHELQMAGAYRLDAPSTTHNPAVRHVLDRHDVGMAH